MKASETLINSTIEAGIEHLSKKIVIYVGSNNLKVDTFFGKLLLKNYIRTLLNQNKKDLKIVQANTNSFSDSDLSYINNIVKTELNKSIKNAFNNMN